MNQPTEELSLTRKRKPLTSNKITFDRLCHFLKVPDSEKWDEENIDSFYTHWEGATEEDLQKAEEESRDEAWRAYYDAVLFVAEQCFDYHGLSLSCHKKSSKDRPFDFRVVPNPGRNWLECANQIRTTINGVGYFHFDTVKEFLDSGPYTAREAALKHLGWIPDWYDVYEGGKAHSRVYRRLR